MSETLIPVQDTSGKRGYINALGAQIVPCIYAETDFFVEGLARVKNTLGKWGYIDKAGNVIVPCIYNDIYLLSDITINIDDPTIS